MGGPEVLRERCFAGDCRRDYIHSLVSPPFLLDAIPQCEEHFLHVRIFVDVGGVHGPRCTAKRAV